MLNNLKEYINHFAKVTSSPQNKWCEYSFKELKLLIAEALFQAVLRNKVSNKGPKPHEETINVFLDALFELLDNGSKCSYLFRHHKISKTSFYKYFNLLIAEKILEKAHENLLKGAIIEDIALLDSSHIRSVKGSEGVDYGFKEKGKKAVKITLLASVNKIIYFHSLDPDNCSDIKAFTKLSNEHPSEQELTVLADKGYVGKQFKANCLKNKHKIICPVKKFRGNVPSHSLTDLERYLLKHSLRSVRSAHILNVYYTS